jgi:hypothetical protein
MGVIKYGKVLIHGNFATAKRYKNGRPRNWIDRDWKAIVPYPFKWRDKLGKVNCDCVEVVEAYQPYYGTSWYHSDECSMMRHIKKYPQIHNILNVSSLIAQTD